MNLMGTLSVLVSWGVWFNFELEYIDLFYTLYFTLLKFGIIYVLSSILDYREFWKIEIKLNNYEVESHEIGKYQKFLVVLHNRTCILI